jgi:hypothetical protein
MSVLRSVERRQYEVPRKRILRRWMNSSGQDSSPIHPGLQLCLVGKTIGDTRRTRVNRNVEDGAAAGAAARATCDVGTLRGTYLFANHGVDATTGKPFAG